MKSRYKKENVVKYLDETPIRQTSTFYPLNLSEQKERFLKYGLLPRFQLKGSNDAIHRIQNNQKGQIGFKYLKEAKHILDTVKKKYGDGDHYQEVAFGKRINHQQGTAILKNYLKDNNLEGAITILWSADLPCSARMLWIGPNVRYKKPENRRYQMWIKDSNENGYLREKGIQCLADHEIGTHFLRALNDGLQPWYADRKTFGIASSKSADLQATEEGLAALNTILHADAKYLWNHALSYYTACMSTEMTFRELFDHLEGFITNPEQRWKICMRVKRGLANVNDLGGYGKDQCYFEGAVEILRNLENIDFNLLYSGKICYNEVNRVKRLARLDCIRLPLFLRNMEKYRRTLKHIATINGIIAAKPSKPSAKRRHRSQQLRGSHLKGNIHTPTPTPRKMKGLSSVPEKPLVSPRSTLSSDSSDESSETTPTPLTAIHTHEKLNNMNDRTEFIYSDISTLDTDNNNNVQSENYSGIQRILKRPTSAQNKIVMTENNNNSNIYTFNGRFQMGKLIEDEHF